MQERAKREANLDSEAEAEEEFGPNRIYVECWTSCQQNGVWRETGKELGKEEGFWKMVMEQGR